MGQTIRSTLMVRCQVSLTRPQLLGHGPLEYGLFTKSGALYAQRNKLPRLLQAARTRVPVVTRLMHCQAASHAWNRSQVTNFWSRLQPSWKLWMRLCQHGNYMLWRSANQGLLYGQSKLLCCRAVSTRCMPRADGSHSDTD